MTTPSTGRMDCSTEASVDAMVSPTTGRMDCSTLLTTEASVDAMVSPSTGRMDCSTLLPTEASVDAIVSPSTGRMDCSTLLTTEASVDAMVSPSTGRMDCSTLLTTEASVDVMISPSTGRMDCSTEASVDVMVSPSTGRMDCSTLLTTETSVDAMVSPSSGRMDCSAEASVAVMVSPSSGRMDCSTVLTTEASVAAMISPSSGRMDCSASDPEEWEEEVMTVLVRVHKDQQPYKCGHCGHLFDTVDQLDAHIQQHGPVRPYRCGYCKENYATNLDLSVHFTAVKHEVLHCIDLAEADSQSVDKTYLSVIQKQNHGLDTEAQRQFAMLDDTVADNPVSHAGEKGRDFVRKKHRRKKIRAVVAPSKKSDSVSCRTCGVSFQRPVDLKKHSVEEHGDDRPFWCSQCPLRYKQKIHLTYHANTAHSTHKPHACPVCGDKFKLRGHLRYHLTSKHHVEPSTILIRKPRAPTSWAFGDRTRNGGEKPRILFTNTSASRRLERSGSGQGREATRDGSCDSTEENGARNIETATDPIVCPTCGQGFQLQVDLKKHSILEHYDDRPFLCPHCPLRCKQQIHLTYHVKSVHGTLKPHPCPLCGDRFKLRGHLRYHILSKHHMEPSTVLKRPSRKHSAGDSGRKTDSEEVSTLGREAVVAGLGLSDQNGRELEGKGMSVSLSEGETTAGSSNSQSHRSTLSALETGLEHSFQTSSDLATEGSGTTTTKVGASVKSKTSDSVSCPTCGLSFQRPVDLKKHSVEEHGDDRPFQCPQCPSCYKQKIHLTYHVNNVHSTHKPHACPVCGDKFKLRVHLKYHVSSKHNVEPSTILKRLSRISGLLGSKGVDAAPTSPSVISDKESMRTSAADESVAEDDAVTADDRSSAAVRRKIFGSPSKSGVGSSTGEMRQKLKCGVCGITFSSYIKLRDHWACAHNACDCGEKFEDPCGMDSHRKAVHGQAKSKGRPYLCAVCGAGFDTTRYLREHIYRLHKKTGRGLRQTRGKKTPGPETTPGHDDDDDATEDSEDKHKFKCGVCDKLFSSPSQIRDHWKRSHNKCDCGKKFTNPRGLLSHRNSAHGKAGKPYTPFLCTVCGTGFQLARYLGDHVCQPHNHPSRKKCPQGENAVYRTRGAAAKQGGCEQSTHTATVTRGRGRGDSKGAGQPDTSDGDEESKSPEQQDRSKDHAYSLQNT